MKSKKLCSICEKIYDELSSICKDGFNPIGLSDWFKVNLFDYEIKIGPDMDFRGVDLLVSAGKYAVRFDTVQQCIFGEVTCSNKYDEVNIFVPPFICDAVSEAFSVIFSHKIKKKYGAL